MESKLSRMWINQPSTLQPCHSMHGSNVLVNLTHNDPYVTVYFISGPGVSARVDRNVLYPGWIY